MKRIWLFASLLAASLVAFLAIVLWYLSYYQSGTGSLGGMMNQMMGGQTVTGMNLQMPSYFWYLAAGLIGLGVIGVVGLVYFLTYPEIARSNPQPVPETVSGSQTFSGSWNFLLQTSNPEEKKVLEVLAAHEGKYLQKFIVKDSGLSKLKTHRILSRFVERGIVTAVSSGNTNEITLASSLRPPPEAK